MSRVRNLAVLSLRDDDQNKAVFDKLATAAEKRARAAA